jgi:hypothetical protein
MLSIRIVAAGALVSVMTVGGAMAQTTTGTGKPIELLQVVTQPDKTKLKSHAKRTIKIKTATKRTGKRHSLAARQRPIHVAEAVKAAAPAAAPATVWPDLTPAAAPANLASAEPAPQPAPAATASTPSELVVGGQTVHVVSPDDANEIDRADAQNAPSAAATQSGIAVAEPASDTATIARAQAETSHVGSASWIAQVLAALGGAIAAGSIAWFLMGSAPQRTYG